MLSKIKLTTMGANELTITYQGVSTNVTLYVEEKDTTVVDTITDKIAFLINSNESLTDEMITNLKTYLEDIKYHNITLSYDDIEDVNREIEQDFFEEKYLKSLLN